MSFGLYYNRTRRCLTRVKYLHIRWHNNMSVVQSVSDYKWLYDHAPSFHINGNNVKVLSSPGEFYDTLKGNIATAKKRVTLASLYLGTGPLENELVSTIKECLDTARQERRDIKVRILLDYMRGSRGKLHNSRTMLLPLKEKFPDEVQISLYHNPKFRGFLRWFIPEKYNEVIGVTHLKVYLTDNNVLLSGANLSEDYFVNRQDRYIVFKECANLAEYFNELVTVVSRFSLTLHPDNTTSMEDNSTVHPYLGCEQTYITEARAAVEEFISKWRNMKTDDDHKINVVNSQEGTNYHGGNATNSQGSARYYGSNATNSQGSARCYESDDINSQGSTRYYGSNAANSQGSARCYGSDDTNSQGSARYYGSNATNSQGSARCHGGDAINSHEENIVHLRKGSPRGAVFDTVVFPLIQMGLLGINQDEIVTCAIFDATPTNSDACLATGYFNLTEEYSQRIIASKGNYHVLCAHPEANGFYKARGIIGGIADAFTQFAKEFYEQVRSAGQEKRFSLKEYRRAGWTFHVKGLWLRHVGQVNPSLTMIGSPNFGHRSVKRDLENQVVVFTHNLTLQHQLSEECERVYKYGVEVDELTFISKERRVPLWAWLVTRLTRSFF